MPKLKFQQPTEEEEEEEKKKLLQTKQQSHQTPELKPKLGARINALRGGGQPLSKSTRAFLELRLGQDFSCVRVHNYPGTVESAGEIGASAYTVGRDMVFDKGHYAPETSAGR